MDTLEIDHAFTALKHGLPFLRSGGNFEIYSVNAAFEELLGYSEYELKKKGWKGLSVHDDDLEADMAITAELVAGKRQSMTIIKSYVSKLGVPIPGQLLAIRYPQGEEPMQCALCFFVPLVNGSKAALGLVVKYIEQHTNASHDLAEKIATMAQDVQIRKSQTKLQSMLYSILDWALENPVKAGAIGSALWVTLATIPQLALRVGLPPQPVQIQVEDPRTGELRPASQQLINSIQHQSEESNVARQKQQSGDPIAHAISAKRIAFETPGGSRFEVVAEYRDGHWRRTHYLSLPRTTGGIRWQGIDSGRGDSGLAGYRDSIDGMSDARSY